MHCISIDTTVGWVGAASAASLPPELAGWNLLPLAPPQPDPAQRGVSPPLPEADLLVLETAAFANVRDCERLAMSVACPVLFVSSREHLPRLVHQLQAKDDICLDDAPPSLLAARLSKLHQSQRALIDPLTGTHRREAFFSYLRHWAMNARHDDPLSLLMLDLDHFKALNDQFGQDVGDDCLQRLGGLLREQCPDSPLIARLGGQEFAILMPTSDQEAARHAESIRQQLSMPGLHSVASTTASIGVASRADVQHIDQLHRVGDEAVYAAKAAGRNRVCVYRELTDRSLLQGEDLDLITLENKSRVMGERVTDYIAQRSRRILQNLRSEAETDGLTSFYNRRYLDRRLKLQFQHHQQSGQPLSLALIDLDHFGAVNKRHGWPTGDKALQTVCDVIRRCIRAGNDWVGRYGGEELFVVLPGVVLDDAIGICQRLRAAVAETPATSTTGEPLQLTVSIGLLQCDGADQDLNAVIERVSKQTLRAKESGRDRVCWAPLREVPESQSARLADTA